MTLNLRTGRALLVRPTTDRGGEMAEKKAPAVPYALQKDGMRVRVCGRWQKKGYEADAEEQAKWKETCKNRGWEPKTGKPPVKKAAAKK